MPNVNHSHFLRMKLHAQFVQNPEGGVYGRSRLRCRLTGNHPVVCKPRELIAFTSHLLIEPRQHNIA